ncbi:MAG: glycosyltransferase family 9 protein [Candidatus Micrarchaeota archaeon]
MNSTTLKAYFWRMLTLMKKGALWAFTLVGSLFFNKSAPLRLGGARRILVIHGEHSSIGDAVLFSGMLHPLRRKFPRAKIDVLIRHPAENILQHNPNCDELIPYAAEEGTNLLTQEFAPFKILEGLRRRNYDLVITSEHAFRFILLSYLTGAPNRVGLDLEGRGFLLTKKVAYPVYDKRNKSELEYYLDIARALGAKVRADPQIMQLHFSKEDAKFASKFLKQNGIGDSDFVVGVHAGGGIWKKRWPLLKFAKLADSLYEKYRAKIIAFGGKGDVELMRLMQKMMGTRLIVAAGKSTVLQTAALVGRCNLIVANDSAISHMAAASGVRVIALFGVDSPVRWGPLNNKAILKHKRLPACNLLCNYDYLYAVDRCFKTDVPYCMDKIGVADVLSEVERIRKNQKRRQNLEGF